MRAMSASAVDELAAAVARAVAAVGGDGVPVRLDRPADPGHGDYATAVALQLAKPLRSAPRDIAARIAAAIESDHLASVDVAGPGFLNLRVSAAWYRDAVERILARGAALRLGHRRHAAADPGRVRVRQPDRPGHRRDGAQRRLRRQPRAPVRVRGPRGRPRVLLQRRRPPDRPLRRVAAGAGAGCRAACGRLSGRVRGGDRGRGRARSRRRRRRVGAGGHRRDDGPHPRHSCPLPLLVRQLVPRAVAVRERGGAARDRPRPRRRPRVRAGRGDVAALVRARRRQGPRARALGRDVHLRRRRPGLHRGQARARVRHGHVRARRPTTTATSAG